MPNYAFRLNLEWKKLCMRHTWQMEKNQPNTRNLLKAELSMPVSYWNKHVHEIEFVHSITTEDEIRQYQASKFELDPL